MPALDRNLWSGASRAQWFANRYPGDIMPHPNVVVLHTTEGTGWPSYSGGAVAPNFTCKPDFTRKRLVWHQHFPANMSARALENHAGGVETNTLNVIQVEIVGTCDPSTHRKWGSTPHLYTEDLPDWAIRDLGKWLAWVHATYPVPFTSDVEWVAYPQSYGPGGQRMSASKWLHFNGVCGHEHVPEQSHGDPGLFPIKKLLAAAGGATLADTSTPQKEWYEMPLDDQTKKEIRAVVVDANREVQDWVNKYKIAPLDKKVDDLAAKVEAYVGDSSEPPARFAGGSNRHWWLKSVTTNTNNIVAALRGPIEKIGKGVEALLAQNKNIDARIKQDLSDAVAELATASAQVDVTFSAEGDDSEGDSK